jgi:hypothetical protein
VNSAGSTSPAEITRVTRRSLTQSYGRADPVVLDQIDALVRVALDL